MATKHVRIIKVNIHLIFLCLQPGIHFGLLVCKRRGFKTKRNLLPFADVAELPCKHRIAAYESLNTMKR